MQTCLSDKRRQMQQMGTVLIPSNKPIRRSKRVQSSCNARNYTCQLPLLYLNVHTHSLHMHEDPYNAETVYEDSLMQPKNNSESVMEVILLSKYTCNIASEFQSNTCRIRHGGKPKLTKSLKPPMNGLWKLNQQRLISSPVPDSNWHYIKSGPEPV